MTRGVTIQALAPNRGPKYADQTVTGRSRGVFIEDRVFYSKGRFYAFLEHSSDELVVAAEDGRPTCFKPEALGCYVIHVNRTDRGLAITEGLN